MTDRRPARVARLRAVVGEAELDALLVQHMPNIRYLTGFTGSAGVLLVTATQVVLVTDFRYAAQAPQEAGNSARVEIESVSLWQRVQRVIGELAPVRVGFESHVATTRDLDRLDGLRARLVPTMELVEGLRTTKSPEEVAAIRAAAALADEALDEVLPRIRAGQSEFEVAALLEAALRRRGSEWHPFPTIVASGPRSALPHARSSGRVLQSGEWLLLDFGAQVDGYCADLTRTVVVGRADQRQRAMYDLVREAQHRAIAQGRAGMPARQMDALARDWIASHGFGEAFGHSLGHGLGLEVHEAPRVSMTAEAPLPPEAVVTVEPGVYFPGWGGVRLEEDVHLTPEGAVLLSRGATDLLELT